MGAEWVAQAAEIVLMIFGVASVLAAALRGLVKVTPLKPGQVYLPTIMRWLDRAEGWIRKAGLQPPKVEQLVKTKPANK